MLPSVKHEITCVISKGIQYPPVQMFMHMFVINSSLAPINPERI